MFVLGSNVFLDSWGFCMEIRCSFSLGFVQRSHKLLNCWGYESKTPIRRKQTWNHHIFCGFMKNWWT